MMNIFNMNIPNINISNRLFRSFLPVFSLIVILIAIFYLQPRSMSYFGLTLLLNLALPIAFATLAQMCIISVNDLDLGIGAFVGMVACIAATLLNYSTILGIFALLICICAYAAMGALIYIRKLPSIVVTLGMSFIWLGIALLILPTPGGKSPSWLYMLMSLKTPWIPFTIISLTVVSLLAHFLLKKTSYATIIRGVGGNQDSISRSGWSILKAKISIYALAGFFGVCSGLSLIGLTTSGDANIALRYTLLSIAGVILGGGEFTGGKISPIGAVIGAITLTLTSSFLSFLNISQDWQIGSQGAILIIILALRAAINRAKK